MDDPLRSLEILDVCETIHFLGWRLPFLKTKVEFPSSSYEIVPEGFFRNLPQVVEKLSTTEAFCFLIEAKRNKKKQRVSTKKNGQKNGPPLKKWSPLFRRRKVDWFSLTEKRFLASFISMSSCVVCFVAAWPTLTIQSKSRSGCWSTIQSLSKILNLWYNYLQTMISVFLHSKLTPAQIP